MVLLEWWWLFGLIPLLLWLKAHPGKKVQSAILALLLLALARPVVAMKSEVDTNVKQIVIALDLSGSMLADDLKPNRFEVAKGAIATLLSELESEDIVTLVGFTKNALLLSPPSSDKQIPLNALEGIDPNLILTRSTSLESLFASLAKWGLDSGNLVIFSDGGDNTKPIALPSLLQGMRLIFAATATNTGAPIKSKEGFLHDEEGRLIITKLNQTFVKQIEKLGGATVPILHANDATQIVDHLQHIEADSKKEDKKRELFYIPLLLATLLFLAYHTTVTKKLFALLLLFGVAKGDILQGFLLYDTAKAYQKRDYQEVIDKAATLASPARELLLLLAQSYYRAGEHDKAIATFKRIKTTDRALKAKLYYNIANSYAKRKEFMAARDYYLKSLMLVDDEDAKHNLSLIEQFLKQNGKQRKSGSSHANNASKSGTKKEAAKKASKSKAKPTPLSSKVYELINKGYIDETRPW